MKNEMDIEHLSYDLPNRRLSIIHEIISKNACAMQRAQSPSLPERREVNENHHLPPPRRRYPLPPPPPPPYRGPRPATGRPPEV